MHNWQLKLKINTQAKPFSQTTKIQTQDSHIKKTKKKNIQS